MLMHVSVCLSVRRASPPAQYSAVLGREAADMQVKIAKIS